MSANPRLSSGDGDATNFGSNDGLKPGRRSDAEGSVKQRPQKPPVRAPKPKPRGKTASDEDAILKNFDDMLDRQEEGGDGVEHEAPRDQRSSLPTSDVPEDAIAAVTVNEHPRTDCDSIISADAAAAVERSVSKDAATTLPQSESSRHSVGDDDDFVDAASSTDDQNQASSPRVSHSSGGRQV